MFPNAFPLRQMTQHDKTTNITQQMITSTVQNISNGCTTNNTLITDTLQFESVMGWISIVFLVIFFTSLICCVTVASCVDYIKERTISPRDTTPLLHHRAPRRVPRRVPRELLHMWPVRPLLQQLPERTRERRQRIRAERWKGRPENLR